MLARGMVIGFGEGGWDCLSEGLENVRSTRVSILEGIFFLFLRQGLFYTLSSFLWEKIYNVFSTFNFCIIFHCILNCIEYML